MIEKNHAYYSKEPAKYIEELISKFNNSISDKKLILIDINHLINMRDAIYARRLRNEINYSIYKQIYEKLQVLVNDKIILCPLTSLLIFEIDKIGDDKKRNETIEIANTLCCPFVANTLLIPPKEKINYYYKIHDISQIQDFVFTPIIMEEWGILANPLLSDSVYQKIEKSNIDYKKHFFDYDLKSFLSKKNRIINYASSQKRHASIYSNNGKSEMDIKDTLIRKNIKSGCDAFADIYDKFKFNSKPVASIFKNAELGYRLTSEEIKANLKIIKEVMPFIFSLATISTALYRDVNRVSNENDFIDINNCCLSPYFDYFFTEKSFSNLLKQGDVGLDKEYSIVIEYNPQLILTHLNSIG